MCKVFSVPFAVATFQFHPEGGLLLPIVVLFVFRSCIRSSVHVPFMSSIGPSIGLSPVLFRFNRRSRTAPILHQYQSLADPVSSRFRSNVGPIPLQCRSIAGSVSFECRSWSVWRLLLRTGIPFAGMCPAQAAIWCGRCTCVRICCRRRDPSWRPRIPSSCTCCICGRCNAPPRRCRTTDSNGCPKGC